MVVRFAIEPQALVDSTYTSPREMKEQHRRLIELWENYGTLVDPGSGTNSITSRFDDESMRKVRTLWQAAWLAKDRCRRIKPGHNNRIVWDSIDSCSDLAVYGTDFELALVETVRGQAYLAIPEEEDVYGTYCGEVEAVLFQYPERSESFSHIINRAKEKVIIANQEIAKVWDVWFQKFAGKARRVDIVDRYGLTTRNVQGLCKILQFLSSELSGYRVTVFCSDPTTFHPYHMDEPLVVRQLARALTNGSGSIETLDVILVPDHQMTRDRYLRLGECAFTIGHGLSEAFVEPRIARDIPCALDARTDGILRTMQSEARRHREARHKLLRFVQGSFLESKIVTS